MLKQRTVADIVKEKIALVGPNPRGWWEAACQVCHDHTTRGGFRFENGFTSYSCWNCKAAFKVEEGTGRISRNARQILEAFGVTRDDLSAVQSSLFAAIKPKEDIDLESLQETRFATPEIALPPASLPLGSDQHPELQAPIIAYLEGRRVPWREAWMHFSTEPRFARRAIAPFTRGGKVIYWQARAIDAGTKPRYLNSPNSAAPILYGFDRLNHWDGVPVFVTEGFFDAVVLKGVALLGSSLNEAKLHVLRQSKRRLIFVLDRDHPGGELGKKVLEEGWEITFVDERVKDANHSVQVLGLPYTIHTLLQNTTRRSPSSQIQVDLGVLLGKMRGPR